MEAVAGSGAVQGTHLGKQSIAARVSWVVGAPEGQGQRLKDCGPGRCSSLSSSSVLLSPPLTSPYLPDKLLFSFQKPAFSRKPFLSSSLMLLVTPVSVSALCLGHIFKAAFVTVL